MGWSFEGWKFKKQEVTDQVEPTVTGLKTEIDDLREKIVKMRYRLSRASRNYVNVDETLKDEIEIKMALLEDKRKKLFEIADPETDDIENYKTIFTKAQTDLLVGFILS